MEYDAKAMSTSYVEFRKKGFWSWDGYLEDALRLIAEASVAGEDPDWLAEARQHWLRQASGVFAGWIHPQLDEFLTTKDRRQVFFQLTDAASQRDDLTPKAAATLTFLVALGGVTSAPIRPAHGLHGVGRVPVSCLRSE